MLFNAHPELEGRHSFLSASKYHWINYDDEKMLQTFSTAIAAMKGTQLHDFASQAIKLGIPLRRSNKTLNAYVNDAIGFRMSPEVLLFYSENAFGTADAICFRENFLRIHDLKTGVGRTSMKQLYVYAAYFCLEYGFKPGEIGMEFRIYQNDDVAVETGDPIEVARIMSKLIAFDRKLKQMKAEAFS